MKVEEIFSVSRASSGTNPYFLKVDLGPIFIFFQEEVALKFLRHLRNRRLELKVFCYQRSIKNFFLEWTNQTKQNKIKKKIFLGIMKVLSSKPKSLKDHNFPSILCSFEFAKIFLFIISR